MLLKAERIARKLEKQSEENSEENSENRCGKWKSLSKEEVIVFSNPIYGYVTKKYFISYKNINFFRELQ